MNNPNDNNFNFNSDNINQVPVQSNITPNNGNINQVSVQPNMIQNNAVAEGNINQVPVQPNMIQNNAVTEGNVNQVPVQPNMMPNNGNINKVPVQMPIAMNGATEEILLKEFIGKNYNKIAFNQLNIPAFFFTTGYMFYRKMYLYSILVFMISIIIFSLIPNPIAILAFNVIVSLTVNKLYLNYAGAKISKITKKHYNKGIDEIKVICSKKGGTSILSVFLGFFIELFIGIIFIIVMLIAGLGIKGIDLINKGKDITINNESYEKIDYSQKDVIVLKGATVSGYICSNSKCDVLISTTGSTIEQYKLAIDNGDFFKDLGHYKEYVNIDISYVKKGNDKIIVDYKMYLKSTKEDITSVKTEKDLRAKIGLYAVGTHKEILTLKKIGYSGTTYVNGKACSSTTYKFTNSKNRDYEMHYTNCNGAKSLKVGSKYNVTFEVVKDTFHDTYTIKNIE